MKVVRVGLVESAYEVLRELILDQRVAPGDHLNIEALAPRMGISQTPLREALVRLEAEGLVVKRPPRGRYLVAPLLDEQSFEHLYLVRTLLEPAAAQLAATAIGEADVRALAEAVERMSDSGTDGVYREYRAFSTEDRRFHEILARAGGNPMLADAILRLRSHHQLARFYRYHGVDAAEGVAEHEAILEAVAGRAPARAAAAMRAHIDGSHDRLRSFLRSGRGGASGAGS